MKLRNFKLETILRLFINFLNFAHTITINSKELKCMKKKKNFRKEKSILMNGKSVGSVLNKEKADLNYAQDKGCSPEFTEGCK